MPYYSSTYVRWQDLFGEVPRLEEVLSELSQLDRVGLLLLISRLNTHQFLDSVRRNREEAIALQEFLICNLFSQEIIGRAQDKLGGTRLDLHRGFHLQQTLTFLRWAAMHCAKTQGVHPDSGQDVLQRVGRCLLKTSDLLFSPEMRRATEQAKKLPSPEAYLDLLLQLWSGLEVNNPPPVINSVVRSDMIFRELLGRVPRRLDIAGEFEKQTGLPLDAYLDMNFGLISYYCLKTQYDLIHDPSGFTLNPKTFFRSMHSSKTAKFWRIEATSIEDLERRLRAPTDLKSQHDFTEFRSKPFLTINEDAVLCMNPGFVQEKLEMGLFWAIASQLTGHTRKQLFDTWGDLFQEYVCWLLDSAVQGEVERFYAFPSFQKKKHRHESFDAVLVAGTSCAVIECKGGFLKAVSKYGENRECLIQDLDHKFGSAEPGAGIEQLVRKIGQVFGPHDSDTRTLEGIDPLKIERIIPVLVLQDRCASSIFAAPWLAERFRDEMKKKQVVPRVPCSGLVVAHVEELEALRPFVMARQMSFMECLLRRVQLGDPEPGQALFDFSDSINLLLTEKNITKSFDGDFNSRFESIIERVSERFFGRSFSGANA